jgi:hypothetical protein
MMSNASSTASSDTLMTTHLANNLLVLIMLASFDHMLLQPWLKSRKALSSRDVGLTRWFFVHSLANLFVCACAFNSMRAVLADTFHALDASHHPNTSAFSAGTQWPLTIINSVHVYHMIGGFRLGPADYFHHCLFIPTISFPGQYYRWGPLANFQAFFISGLPGGIDYFLLGLVKLGLISPLFEKRVNANANIWLRVPGILVSTMLMYQAVLYGQHQVPLWACILQMLLAPCARPVEPAGLWLATRHPMRQATPRQRSPLTHPVPLQTTRCTLGSKRVRTTPCISCSTCSARTSSSRSTSSSARRGRPDTR